MPFETLKQSNLKRNIIIGVVVVLIISAIVLNFTRAKYRSTASVPIVNSVINYSRGDIIVSAYYNNELLETFPTKSDGYSVESITCDNDATATFNEDTWELTVNNLVTRGTKCNITFVEKRVSTKEILLAHYPTVLTRNNFSTTVEENTTGVIYKSLNSSQYDNDGEVYYFAGNPTDNWVKFAGFYWRIIRINGDGSVRLIYSGSEQTGPVSTGAETAITQKAFNNTMGDNNMYVGFMYEENNAHGTSENSTVKETLDDWYLNNLITYSNKISTDAGFCNDRTPYSGSGVGTDRTYYAAYNRLTTNKSPSFKCTNNNDLFTISTSNKGNKALTYPIGLITADEVAYAGGVYSSSVIEENYNYYLNSEIVYATMTPQDFYLQAMILYVWSKGEITDWDVWDQLYIRPVINLDDNVALTGTGTSTDPFVVEGAE